MPFRTSPRLWISVNAWATSTTPPTPRSRGNATELRNPGQGIPASTAKCSLRLPIKNCNPYKFWCPGILARKNTKTPPLTAKCIKVRVGAYRFLMWCSRYEPLILGTHKKMSLDFVCSIFTGCIMSVHFVGQRQGHYVLCRELRGETLPSFAIPHLFPGWDEINHSEFMSHFGASKKKTKRVEVLFLVLSLLQQKQTRPSSLSYFVAASIKSTVCKRFPLLLSLLIM